MGHQCKHFSKLSYIPVSGGKWMLNMPLIYFNPRGKNYVVPHKFRTDFASIPKIFQGIISKRGKYDSPSVLHDYLYKSGTVSKFKADKIFRLAMKDCGVKVWKQWSMWGAVALGGWYGWTRSYIERRKK